MDLLLFAHRGEAKTFIKTDNYKPVADGPPGLLQNSQGLLLIAGEGVQNTTAKLSAAVAVCQTTVSRVVNMGIAGALHAHLQRERVYPLATCYMDRGDEFEYKSYGTQDFGQTEAVDCITVLGRAFDQKALLRLSPMAALVDRECWAAAAVCELFQVPLHSYKLVSDHVGEQTNWQEIVQNSSQQSTALYQYYHRRTPPLAESKPEPLDELGKNFYCTASQRQRLVSLLARLQQKERLSPEAILARAGLETIGVQDIPPKQRTQLLLINLGDLLNPFHKKLRQKLDTIIEPLVSAGCRVQFAQDYQSSDIELAIRLENKKKLERFKRALERFDYQQMKAVLDGDADV